jgi:hypothetical protein
LRRHKPFALVGEQFLAKIVNIRAFAIEQIAEEPAWTILRMSVSL